MNIDHCFAQSRLTVMRAIENVARACKRDPHDIALMAVSKTVGIADIISMYSTGQRLFGENRVQEAEAKFTSRILQDMPEIELHYIGVLQRNKAKKALALFHCIQGVDNLPLLMELAKACASMPQETVKTRSVFLQVNPLADSAKAGFVDYNALLCAARRAREQVAQVTALRVRGLMTIAPFHKGNGERTERETQEAFELTRMWGQRLQVDMNYEYDMELSMGMSGDFVCAIREQSTMIRVGTALFGKRL